MKEARSSAALTRRGVLKLGGAALAGGLISVRDLAAPVPVLGQTPKRGGVFRFPGFDPPHFDPHQSVHWWTFIYTSLTHGGLMRVKAGPNVTPGTLPVEPHLAESWERPNETTYVFKLRKGVRWHNKPPVNGRELVADDVVYTYQRALTLKGNPNRATFEEIDKIETVDKYTVKFTLKEPYAWFLDSPAIWPILAKEAADSDGSFKKMESVIGTGPWMLERYEPNVRLSFVRNPNYFQSGLPHVDTIESRIDTDPASKLAAWLGGQYDFAPEIHMTMHRTDLDVVKRRKPNLQMTEFTWLISTFGAPNLDAEPFKDIRVRRAFHMAVNQKDVIQVNPFGYGQGTPNTIVPSAFRDWAIPIDQLPPEGRRLYQHDPEEAKRLLAQAGVSNPLKLPAGVDEQLGSRVLRHGAGDPRPVEEVRHRGRPQAEKGQRVHRHRARSQVREGRRNTAWGPDDTGSLPREPAARAAAERRGRERPEAQRHDHESSGGPSTRRSAARSSTTSSATSRSRRTTCSSARRRG